MMWVHGFLVGATASAAIGAALYRRQRSKAEAMVQRLIGETVKLAGDSFLMGQAQQSQVLYVARSN